MSKKKSVNLPINQVYEDDKGLYCLVNEFPVEITALPKSSAYSVALWRPRGISQD